MLMLIWRLFSVGSTKERSGDLNDVIHSSRMSQSDESLDRALSDWSVRVTWCRSFDQKEIKITFTAWRETINIFQIRYHGTRRILLLDHPLLERLNNFNTVSTEIEHIREDDEYNASMEAARKAVHGKGDENFTQWTAFGSCTATCGRSLQTRTRSCKPGTVCKGQSVESRTCIQTPCPGKL